MEKYIVNKMFDETEPVSDFYFGKSVLITGGSTCIGNILTEKLLRSCQGIRHIYLLMRRKKKYRSSQRLSDILNTVLFSKIREKNPDVLRKVVLIKGDMSLPDLGISDFNIQILLREVAIVFHCAAVTNYSKTAREIISDNVFGTYRVLDFCRRMEKIQAFVFVSTLYSTANYTHIEEYLPVIPEFDGKFDFRCIDEKSFMQAVPLDLIRKWPNNYAFSKAVAEILLDQAKDTLPISIVRPSMILSSAREPVPGWIDNFYGPTIVVYSGAIGALRSFLCDVDKVAHLIPSDVVANLLITVAWKTAAQKSTDIKIYNCCTSKRNPIQWGELMKNCSEQFRVYPPNNIVRFPHIKYFTSCVAHLITSFVRHDLEMSIRCLIACKFNLLLKLRLLLRICQTFESVTVKQWTVNDSNVVSLYNELLKKDREIFSFDIENINWNTYIKHYVMGIKIHLLNENVDDVDVL